MRSALQTKGGRHFRGWGAAKERAGRGGPKDRTGNQARKVRESYCTPWKALEGNSTKVVLSVGKKWQPVERCGKWRRQAPYVLCGQLST